MLFAYSIAESRTRAYKETCANRSTDCDHMEMAWLHGGVEITSRPSPAREGLGGKPIASPEAQVLPLGIVWANREAIVLDICGRANAEIMFLVLLVCRGGLGPSRVLQIVARMSRVLQVILGVHGGGVCAENERCG